MDISDTGDILNEFQQMMVDVLDEPALESKSFLLRFLVAREFDLVATRKLMTEYLNWKSTNEIHTILDWKAPTDLVKACPYQILGENSDGNAAILCPIGSWNLSVVRAQQSNFVKYMDQVFHRAMYHSGDVYGGKPFIFIGDAKGFTYELWKVIKVLIEIGRQFEPHYPELLRHAVIVNCPYIFEVCYGVVAPVIAKRTRQKIHIFGTNRSTWKQHIADQIPVTIIPDEYR